MQWRNAAARQSVATSVRGRDLEDTRKGADVDGAVVFQSSDEVLPRSAYCAVVRVLGKLIDHSRRHCASGHRFAQGCRVEPNEEKKRRAENTL